MEAGGVACGRSSGIRALGSVVVWFTGMSLRTMPSDSVIGALVSTWSRMLSFAGEGLTTLVWHRCPPCRCRAAACWSKRNQAGYVLLGRTSVHRTSIAVIHLGMAKLISTTFETRETVQRGPMPYHERVRPVDADLYGLPVPYSFLLWKGGGTWRAGALDERSVKVYSCSGAIVANLGASARSPARMVSGWTVTSIVLAGHSCVLWGYPLADVISVHRKRGLNVQLAKMHR